MSIFRSELVLYSETRGSWVKLLANRKLSHISFRRYPRFNVRGKKEVISMHRLVAILALCVTAVFAQTNRGSISGTVSDQTQAVMGGVTVTITNLGTNEVRKVTTAANGSYSATNLEPVSYKGEAQFARFKKTVLHDAKIDTST